ncbi:Uncharacterised protein [Shigella sonnei]|nr:Uncharacterised protein [Shigella sonnei]
MSRKTQRYSNGLPPPEKGEKGSVLLVPARWLNWNLKFCNYVRR